METMTTLTNEDRADFALAAVRTYASRTRFLEADREMNVNFEEIAVDLLCDLMHAFDSYGEDFDYLLSRAREHYNAEIAEEA
jgi:hypothetical protein